MLSDGHLAEGEVALFDELAKAWPHPAALNRRTSG